MIRALLLSLVLATAAGAQTIFEETGSGRWQGEARATVVGVFVLPDGSPAVGAVATFFDRDPSWWRAEFEPYHDGVTDSLGRLRCDAVPADRLLGLIIRHPGSAVREFSLGLLREGESYDLGTVVLHPGARVEGQVLDARGRPVPGLRVHARVRFRRNPMTRC